MKIFEIKFDRTIVQTLKAEIVAENKREALSLFHLAPMAYLSVRNPLDEDELGIEIKEIKELRAVTYLKQKP